MWAFQHDPTCMSTHISLYTYPHMKYVYMSFESKVSCCLESQTSIETNINQTLFFYSDMASYLSKPIGVISGGSWGSYPPWNKHSTSNRPCQQETFIFQPSILRCYVSFREVLLFILKESLVISEYVFGGWMFDQQISHLLSRHGVFWMCGHLALKP